MMQQRLENPDFERNLFFIDEANFHTHGVPNWASKNPHKIIQNER
jgi:hypothetical protein